MIYFDVKLRRVSYDLIVLIYGSKQMNFFIIAIKYQKEKKKSVGK